MQIGRAILLLSILSMSILPNDILAQTNMKGLQLGTPFPRLVIVTPTPTPTPTPPSFAQKPAPRKPIPLRWKIAAVAGTALVSLAVLVYAARAWRTWNLFDRQYRFPRVTNAPLRLGAMRSGGCMATLEFRRDDSTAEDA